jgi:phage repressor protein C with HTH and peptisase S24 domain
MPKEILENLDICRRFTEIRKEKKPSKRQFSKDLGINQSVVGDIELGYREPSREVLVKLAKVYNVNINWLLTGEGEMYLSSKDIANKKPSKTGFKQIPVYSEKDLPEGSFVARLLEQKLSAGEGSYIPDEDEVKALIRVPAYLSQYGENIAALTVDGDSMVPTLKRGDLVVCDSCGWSGEGIYAIKRDGSAFVKRVAKQPGKFIIISDNKIYDRYEIPEGSLDIELIGRVHCVITTV